jgi:hypothetical protein
MWSGDRHVASCDGDGVLRKTALASKHMLRAPSGWCFDAAIIATAEARGVQRVEVRDSETGDLYTAALSDFRAHGIELDRGHGPQVCLPLTRWRVTRRGAPRQLTLL